MAQPAERIAPPALNTAKEVYDRGATEQFRNVLRLFFNRLVALVNYLIDRDVVAFHSDSAGEVAALTSKPTPIQADVLFIEDSEDAWAKKQITVGDLMRDFYLEVAKGNVVGHTSVNKFGENFTVTADTYEDIWDGGGSYLYPTTATITHVSQATDQVGTDGGATIEVQGLDVNWVSVTQNVDLDATNTTTEVALTTALLRVYRMRVLEDITLAADISAVASGGATTYATILAGNNQTLMALFSVPAGKTAYMSKYYASVTPAASKVPAGASIRVWAADRASGYEFQLKHSIGIQASAAGVEHMFLPHQAFTEKTDIRINAAPLTNAGQISAGFDLILVDN